VEMCVLCHTAQTVDPDTGNTLDFPVMMHKVHAGSTLPSVQAGGKYEIIGHNQDVSDWSTVVFPADVRRCEVCHVPGASTQADLYLKPTRAACGACHDNVNFATGQNHVDLPQVTDNECANCHVPQGELEFDASIKGAHTIPEESTTRPGMNFEILKVDNGTAGNTPTITFTLRDNSGAGIPLSSLTASPGRLAAVMAGPTTDYGYTSFGSDVTTPGYVSENILQGGTCTDDGTCTYTFKHAIPANATGTYAIGLEGRRGLTLLPGTQKQMTTEYGAINKVTYFSVDGSTVAPRRKVVDIANCNKCHSFLSLHGENRNQIEMCVLCHNPSENDSSQRPNAQDAAQKAMPPQGVDFAYMIHRIHTGEQMLADGGSYTIVGFGGSVNDFSEVRYPAMSRSGATGERRNCEMCHVNGSENLPLQAGLNQVTNPQALINPAGPATTACTGCHVSTSAASHALAQTTTQLGESCEVCHGSDAQFSVSRIHAQ
jgi:OmcA/MtrC family decaheme c-type cytochrome